MGRFPLLNPDRVGVAALYGEQIGRQMAQAQFEEEMALKQQQWLEQQESMNLEQEDVNNRNQLLKTAAGMANVNLGTGPKELRMPAEDDAAADKQFAQIVALINGQQWGGNGYGGGGGGAAATSQAQDEAERLSNKRNQLLNEGLSRQMGSGQPPVVSVSGADNYGGEIVVGGGDVGPTGDGGATGGGAATGSANAATITPGAMPPGQAPVGPMLTGLSSGQGLLPPTRRRAFSPINAGLTAGYMPPPRRA